MTWNASVMQIDPTVLIFATCMLVASAAVYHTTRRNLRLQYGDFAVSRRTVFHITRSPHIETDDEPRFSPISAIAQWFVISSLIVAVLFIFDGLFDIFPSISKEDFIGNDGVTYFIVTSIIVENVFAMILILLENYVVSKQSPTILAGRASAPRSKSSSGAERVIREVPIKPHHKSDSKFPHEEADTRHNFDTRLNDVIRRAIDETPSNSNVRLKKISDSVERHMSKPKGAKPSIEKNEAVR